MRRAQCIPRRRRLRSDAVFVHRSERGIMGFWILLGYVVRKRRTDEYVVRAGVAFGSRSTRPFPRHRSAGETAPDSASRGLEKGAARNAIGAAPASIKCFTAGACASRRWGRQQLLGCWPSGDTERMGGKTRFKCAPNCGKLQQDLKPERPCLQRGTFRRGRGWARQLQEDPWSHSTYRTTYL
jgi:hypothetical protein